eukprot:TRINITY_DN9118_c0_g2_i2.p1 TRINITY_DN9118_c0_g2~~TRINITY_DN9118_c0_g2_i2.p1  ORF type:complete len:365 (+),score=66.24 TRINITY_DN9118_c0_g2_i2:109-1095(+)
MDLVAKLRPLLSQDPLRHPFDVAVRCLGWRADLSILDETLQRHLVDQSGFSSSSLLGYPSGKYPKMDSGYQALGAPGLYFAGALSHGRDYKRSAGGFIHGFRYTARALYRVMRSQHVGSGWPNQTFYLHKSESRIRWMRKVLRRINEAAGPYQMFGELTDAMLFTRSPEGLVAHYLEEVPNAYLREHRELSCHPQLVLTFAYGRSFSPLDLPSPGAVSAEFAEFSAFLHPRLALFEGSCSGAGGGYSPPILTHAMVEDVFTEWTSLVGHIDPLFRFLAATMLRVAPLLGLAGGGSGPDGQFSPEEELMEMERIAEKASSEMTTVEVED